MFVEGLRSVEKTCCLMFKRGTLLSAIHLSALRESERERVNMTIFGPFGQIASIKSFLIFSWPIATLAFTSSEVSLIICHFSFLGGNFLLWTTQTVALPQIDSKSRFGRDSTKKLFEFGSDWISRIFFLLLRKNADDRLYTNWVYDASALHGRVRFVCVWAKLVFVLCWKWWWMEKVIAAELP